MTDAMVTKGWMQANVVVSWRRRPPESTNC